MVEQALYAHILPLPTYSPNPANGKTAEVHEVAWTDRLLNVVRYLSEKGVNALINLSNLKTRQVLQVLYGSCAHYVVLSIAALLITSSMLVWSTTCVLSVYSSPKTKSQS